MLTLMTFVQASQFHIYLPWVNACLAQCLNSVLNVNMLVGTFNQEKALVGAFCVSTNFRVDPRFQLQCPPPGLGHCQSWANIFSLRGQTKLTTECDSDGHDGDTVTSRRIVTQIYTPTKTKTLQSPKFEMRFSLLQIRVFCNVHQFPLVKPLDLH